MNVLIFKTNISNGQDVKTVERALMQHQSISKCSVDCEDVDNVLRIEASPTVNKEEVTRIINSAGYSCEELPD